MAPEMTKNGYHKYIIPVPSIESAGIGPWPFHPKTELITGVLQDECALIQRIFSNQKGVNSLGCSKADIEDGSLTVF